MKNAKIRIHGIDDNGKLLFSVLGTEYRTNSQREGLWEYYHRKGHFYNDGGKWIPLYEWVQISGNCQFTPPKSRSGQYKYIKKWFFDDNEEE